MDMCHENYKKDESTLSITITSVSFSRKLQMPKPHDIFLLTKTQ